MPFLFIISLKSCHCLEALYIYFLRFLAFHVFSPLGDYYCTTGCCIVVSSCENNSLDLIIKYEWNWQKLFLSGREVSWCVSIQHQCHELEGSKEKKRIFWLPTNFYKLLTLKRKLCKIRMANLLLHAQCSLLNNVSHIELSLHI